MAKKKNEKGEKRCLPPLILCEFAVDEEYFAAMELGLKPRTTFDMDFKFFDEFNK